MYKIILFLIKSGITIASLWHWKAKLWVIGRRNWREKLVESTKDHSNWIWFHCASVGEYEDSIEVFTKIQKEFNEAKIILTFFSPSGYQRFKDSSNFDLVTYLPIDFKNNAKNFVEIIQPKFVVFSRSELWLNYLIELNKKKIPVFLTSFAINNSSKFLKWPMQKHYSKCFKLFTHIFCQSEKSQQIITEKLNLKNTSCSGSSRFERIYKEYQKNIEIEIIKNFIGNDFVVVFGSSLEKEENIFIELYASFSSSNIKWIVVPHEFERSKLLSNLSYNNVITYSDLKNSKGTENVILIDKVGLLKHLYKYANIVFVGGGFNSIGIHNIIEPIIYGVPTFFGPNHRNYEEAIDTLELGFSKIITSTSEFSIELNKCLEKKTKKHDSSLQLDYILTKKSNADNIFSEIKSKI